MTERDRQIIGKILSEIDVIDDMLEGMDETAFLKDERTVRAVCMTLINIGELVKNVTPELRESRRDIPWRAIAGMRDVTAHKYQTLRKEDVFSTCTEDIPVFRKKLLEL